MMAWLVRVISDDEDDLHDNNIVAFKALLANIKHIPIDSNF